MASRICLFFFLVFVGTRLSSEFPPTLIVWNVGQGQWATIVDARGCWHFDVGGEFAPWSAVMAECRDRRNFVSLSHWDWDHVGFVGRARFYLPNICLLLSPQGTASARKERLIAGMEPCTEVAPKVASDGARARAAGFTLWNGTTNKNANASSRVILSRRVLLPGDSSRDQEKFWSREMVGVASARVLVLGHHGSATSTGKDLLRRIRDVRLAIASARFRRYGHPHPRVRADLSRSGVPLLRTEDWGTIRVRL